MFLLIILLFKYVGDNYYIYNDKKFWCNTMCVFTVKVYKVYFKRLDNMFLYESRSLLEQQATVSIILITIYLSF